jgi:hypothetical protein
MHLEDLQDFIQSVELRKGEVVCGFTVIINPAD